MICTESQALADFAERIRKSKRILFFGGAGVSTESGMKDYRSEDGIYNTVREYAVSPETILSHSFFLRQPEIFYDFYYKYFLNTDARPNRAHYALAKLEEMGKLQAIVTQNVDGLHQKAGSKNVIELHGTILRHFCIDCGAPASLDEVRACGGSVARCKKCGGILRPDIVLYEEPLDEEVIDAATDAIASADMLIIGGTSLAVYPAASFVQYFKGENVVLLNKSETDYDNRAALIFRDSIGEVFDRVMQLL